MKELQNGNYYCGAGGLRFRVWDLRPENQLSRWRVQVWGVWLKDQDLGM